MDYKIIIAAMLVALTMATAQSAMGASSMSSGSSGDMGSGGGTTGGNGRNGDGTVHSNPDNGGASTLPDNGGSPPSGGGGSPPDNGGFCKTHPSVCNDHRPHCPRGFHMGAHRICHKTIIINRTIHSNSGNHNLNSQCFDEIKIVWLGHIKRGSNPAVDNLVDRCLGIS